MRPSGPSGPPKRPGLRRLRRRAAAGCSRCRRRPAPPSRPAIRPRPCPSRCASTAATRPLPPGASSKPSAVVPSATMRFGSAASSAACSRWIRGRLLQRSRLSKPKAVVRRHPRQGLREHRRPGARASRRPAPATARARPARSARPAGRRARAAAAKSTGSNGRQRPPQRFDAPPSRRATVISGAWWLAGSRFSACDNACASARGAIPPLSSSSTLRPRRPDRAP